MPVMKVDGTNTAQSTSAIEISAVPTSSIVRRDASRAESPAAMLRSTFSTTTMASSTTMPIASTSPKSDSALIEKPKRYRNASVPTIDTGTATSGMIEARQVCRNRITTSTTSATDSNSVCTTDLIEARTNCVGSYTIW